MHKALLLGIIALGFLLRTVSLDVTPPSLNWDEVSHGYNAYSILRTGQDEWGQLLPLTNFRAYGDYPLPLNLYITIPFITTLGLNESSVRLPHAILGVLTVIASYFLAFGVTKRRDIGLLVALLVSIEPWFVFSSRFVAQSNLSVFFLIASMAAFFNREKSKYLIALSFFFLGLTLFSYHTTRIFSPLLLLVLLFVYRKGLTAIFKKERVVFALSLFILILFFAPLPFILANPEARARSQVVFLLDDDVAGKLIEQRRLSALPEGLIRLVYNRPVYFTGEFLKNYFQYFSPIFLFFEGGTQYQFSISHKGLLYPVGLPFFYLGLLILIKGALNNKQNHRFLALWLLLALIPASMTKEDFAVLRSTSILPLPQLLTVFGLIASWEWWKKTITSVEWNMAKTIKFVPLILYFILLAAFLEGYLSEYFGDYRKNYSWSWQYGYKEVVNYAKVHYNEYDKIIVTKKYGEPHEFILFYWPWDPAKYRSDPNIIRFYQSNWYWVDRFDKFYFVNDWEIPRVEDARLAEDSSRFGDEADGESRRGKWKMESGGEIPITGRTLLITSPANYPPGWNMLNTIYFLDGKPAFDILEKETIL